MQDFRKLVVWQKAHVLSLSVYRATADFPDAERFGLTGQIRRAVVSVEANIAEGSARGSDGDCARFLTIAMGSAAELQSHLLLVLDLGLVGRCAYETLETSVSEVKRMLAALIRKLRAAS